MELHLSDASPYAKTKFAFEKIVVGLMALQALASLLQKISTK